MDCLRKGRQTLWAMMIASAISRMDLRVFMLWTWMRRNASCSLEAVLVHQDALGAVHGLAGVQLVFQVRDLVLQLDEFFIAVNGDGHGRVQVGLFERLDQVVEDAGLGRPLDQVFLGVGRQQQHGGDALRADHLARLNAVHFRHLDVQDHDVGLEFAGQFHGLGAVAGLADDLMAHVFQCLPQVQPDDRLVVRDYDTQRFHSGCVVSLLTAEPPWPCVYAKASFASHGGDLL